MKGWIKGDYNWNSSKRDNSKTEEMENIPEIDLQLEEKVLIGKIRNEKTNNEWVTHEEYDAIIKKEERDNKLKEILK
jgi:hypothetical protein